MNRIFALFSNQKEAQEAVTALAESPLDEPEIHLIEDLQEGDANQTTARSRLPKSSWKNWAVG